MVKKVFQFLKKCWNFKHFWRLNSVNWRLRIIRKPRINCFKITDNIFSCKIFAAKFERMRLFTRLSQLQEDRTPHKHNEYWARELENTVFSLHLQARTVNALYCTVLVCRRAENKRWVFEWGKSLSLSFVAQLQKVRFIYRLRTLWRSTGKSETSIYRCILTCTYSSCTCTV